MLGHQRIGPFDVTRLAANDPTALATWLTDKGFPHPDGLDANLAPYVADGWEIVAIQLAPAEAGDSLTGDLQPLRLSFASDKVVYPMRLSRSATTPQASTSTSSPSTEWIRRRCRSRRGDRAGVRRAASSEADVSPALAPYVGDGAFLTRWTNHINDPAAIDGDYVFEPAAIGHRRISRSSTAPATAATSPD